MASTEVSYTLTFPNVDRMLACSCLYQEENLSPGIILFVAGDLPHYTGFPERNMLVLCTPLILTPFTQKLPLVNATAAAATTALPIFKEVSDNPILSLRCFLSHESPGSPICLISCDLLHPDHSLWS